MIVIELIQIWIGFFIGLLIILPILHYFYQPICVIYFDTFVLDKYPTNVTTASLCDTFRFETWKRNLVIE